MDIWEAGKSWEWIWQFDNVLLHFGNESSVRLRVWKMRNRLERCNRSAFLFSEAYLGFALAFDFLAQLLFQFRTLQYLYDTLQ